MISDYRCFFCFARAFETLLEKENLPLLDKNAFTAHMAELYVQSANRFSAPAFARELHIALKQYTNNADPYKEVKQKATIWFWACILS